MNIAIIGAGAMGGLFGARLTAAGENVTLVDIWLEHVAAINEKGLTVLELDMSESVARPHALQRVEDVTAPDLVIVFVKSTMTREAVLNAKCVFGPETRVLTLQNGLGNAEKIAEVVDAAKVLAGTTAQGATLLGPGRVRHGGAGPTHIGCLAGGMDPFAQKVAEMLSRAGLPTVVDADVTSLIWGKLVVNVGINALTALLHLRNGQLTEFDETRELVAMAVEEAVQVAKAAGVTLPYENAVHKVLAVATSTACNQSSMLQDVLRRRRTEIDAINGALVQEGLRLGIATPVNRTLTLLVRNLEKNVGNFL